MNDRPTDEQLEDAAETGRCGCLLPEIEDEGHCDAEAEEADDE